MTKITVETINRKKYTVVWHEEKTWESDNSDPVINIPLRVSKALIGQNTGVHVATILPALPRHPKPEHAPLLHRYAAEGLTLMADGKYYPEPIEVLSDKIRRWNWEITHATHNGERVEIAIEDAE